MPPYVAAHCLFISPLRMLWAWLSDTQELCAAGLISLDRQDLYQALTSTATAALSALYICRPASRCSSEPNSLVGRERNREGAGTESWGGDVWRRTVGEAFRKNVRDILLGCTEGKISDTTISWDTVLAKSNSVLSPVGVASLTSENQYTGGIQIFSNWAVMAIKGTNRNDATGLVWPYIINYHNSTMKCSQRILHEQSKV